MAYLDKPSMTTVYMVPGIAVVAGAQLLGAPMWVPALLAGACGFVISKVRPDLEAMLLACASGLLAHGLLMLLGGALQSGMLSFTLPDVLISVVLTVWLVLRPGLWPVIAVVAYEVVSIAINATMLSNFSWGMPQFGGLVQAILIRVFVIVTAGIALSQLSRSHDDASEERLQDVFD